MTNNKRKNFDIGDHCVVTHEATSPVYVVVGVKGNKLGIVDAIRALIAPGTSPIWLAAELFEVPLSFQLDRFHHDYTRIERMMQAKALGENLHVKCDGNHAAPICSDHECWLREWH